MPNKFKDTFLEKVSLLKKKTSSTQKNKIKLESLIEVKPVEFGDVKYISKLLLMNHPVKVSLINLSKVDILRTIDFLSGVILAKGGTYKKLENKIYLLCPTKDIDSVEIES